MNTHGSISEVSSRDELEERLDYLKRQVLHNTRTDLALTIFRLKRKVHKVRRVSSEGRNVIGMRPTRRSLTRFTSWTCMTTYPG